MLNFDFFNQRAEVKRALSSRLNHNCMDEIRYQDRQAQRTNFSQVVWVIPYAGKTPQYDQAVPAVSKDLSIQGLSIVHQAELTDAKVLMGVPGELGMSFFQCNVEHCSKLGYGFFQIGLFPMKVVTMNNSEARTWEARIAEFETEDEKAPAESVS